MAIGWLIVIVGATAVESTGPVPDVAAEVGLPCGVDGGRAAAPDCPRAEASRRTTRWPKWLRSRRVFLGRC